MPGNLEKYGLIRTYVNLGHTVVVTNLNYSSFFYQVALIQYFWVLLNYTVNFSVFSVVKH